MNNFQKGFIKGTIVAIALVLGLGFWLDFKVVLNHSDAETPKEQVKAGNE